MPGVKHVSWVTSALLVSLSCRLFLKRMVPEQVRSRCTWGYFFSTVEVNAYIIQQSNLGVLISIRHCKGCGNTAPLRNRERQQIQGPSSFFLTLPPLPARLFFFFFLMCKLASSLSLRFVTAFRSSLDDEGSHKIFLFGVPCVSLSQPLPVV